MNRGALNLIANYGTDSSSDDDVPACRVSVKRTLKQSEHNDYENSKRKLPVPSILTDFSNKHGAENVTDDPVQHDGRIRSFPHERGNWATLVYIPYEVSPGVEAIIEKLTGSLPEGELKTVDHFHLSLTKTVILRHHWIDLFVQSVKDVMVCMRSFVVVLGDLKVYCNEERTRTFVGFETKTGYDSLIKMVNGLDSCLKEFKQPEFYKDPSFHISIAWCLGDYQEELKSLLTELSDDIGKIQQSYPQDDFYLTVDNVECKTGNKIFKFSFG